MWVLLIIIMTPTGQTLGGFNIAVPDQEACMVMGDDMTRATSALDTFHCVDMAALVAQGAGS